MGANKSSFLQGVSSSEIDHDADDVDGNDDEELAAISDKVDAFRFFIPIGLSADPSVLACIQLLQIRHRGESLRLEETQEEVSVHLAEPRVKPKQGLDADFARAGRLFLHSDGRQEKVAVIRVGFHVLLLEKAGRIRRSQADKEKTCRRGLLLHCRQQVVVPTAC